jgi:uncharacterized protein YqhQ
MENNQADYLEKAEGTGVCKKTSIGGQALIEGLMMLGPDKQSIAVRNSDGEIVLTVKDRPSFANRFNIPFLRGIVRLVTQLKTGVGAISYSADIAMQDEKTSEDKKKSRFDQFADRHPQLVMGFTLVFSIALSVAIFILLPSALTDLIRKVTGFGSGQQKGGMALALSFIEGFVRIAIFIMYLWLASLSKDIKRVWMFHGSEHKTIAAYEAGLPLTVENVRPMSRFHPRCGTSFLFLVMIISILAFAVVGRYALWINIVIRLALLPLVTGISYEIIKLAGTYDNALTRVISKPGLALQRLTTAEPYTYDLPTSGVFQTFPLTSGNGHYTLNIYRNISGDKYAFVDGASFDVILKNEFTPFLHPSQYVDYTEETAAVAHSEILAQGASDDLDVVKRIYYYVVNNIVYDMDKAKNVPSSYLPDLDDTLHTKRGICFDYAALMTAMLRVQRIPTRLVIGYAGKDYHAWISVYTPETGWIDGIIHFDGKNWVLMDPTFAAGRGLADYIGDGSNYNALFYY